MKQTKREYLIFHSYYDCTGIAKHLEDMSARGWLLEKIGPGGWQYRRVDPRQLRFSVVYFPRATQFDPSPSEQLETFRDFCAEAGWILAADSAQMQVFYNEDPDAVPIETDPEVQLKNMHRAMKRSFLSTYWLLLALCLFQTGFFLYRIWKDPVDELSRTWTFISGFGYVPLLLLVSVELIRYYHWRRRTKAAAESGTPLPELHSAGKLNLAVMILAIAELMVMFASTIGTSRITAVSMILTLVFIPIMNLLANGATNAMKHLRFKTWLNRVITYGMLIVLSFGMMAGIITLVFVSDRIPWLDDAPPAETYEAHGMTWDVYHDNIPLRVEDLVDVDYDEWSTEVQQDESFLLTHTEYTQNARLGAPKDIPDLEYEIVDVKADFVYDLCKRDFITKYWYNHPEEYRDNYLPIDAVPWGADEVYQRHNYDGSPSNYFLICWENRLAEIHFYWKPTAEQIAIAAEILKNA